MKKLITIITLSIALGCAAQTNRTGTTSVTGSLGGEVSAPVIVTNNFANDYPNVLAVWSVEEDNYAAHFRDDKTNLAYIITYDRYGNLVQKDSEVQPANRLEPIVKYYEKRYPKEEFVVWQTESKKGSKTYYILREESILYFDKRGKYTLTKANKNKAIQLTEKSK